MNTSTEVLKWSDTGKRIELQIEEKEENVLFIVGKKVCGYKLFVLGSEAALAKYKGKESQLGDKIAAGRLKWLQNAGKRYYNFMLEKEGINVRIYKSKYITYES